MAVNNKETGWIYPVSFYATPTSENSTHNRAKTPFARVGNVSYNVRSTPSYPHIEAYYARRQDLIEFGGSDNKLNIRPAFQNCLDAYCRDHKENLVLIPIPSALGNLRLAQTRAKESLAK